MLTLGAYKSNPSCLVLLRNKFGMVISMSFLNLSVMVSYTIMPRDRVLTDITARTWRS